MQGIRGVISTLTSDGQEVMGPGVLVWHYPDNSIVNNSLLTVESNHFCVLKSRGAILNVYDTGQYPVTTPDRPILGSFTQAFFGGQSPWQYEALYVNRAKMVVKATGLALSSEMAEMSYEVDYYFHVASKEDAVALVTHMPISRARDHRQAGQRLCDAGRRAGDQPGRAGDPARARQREDPRDRRDRARPPAGLPEGRSASRSIRSRC